MVDSVSQAVSGAVFAAEVPAPHAQPLKVFDPQDTQSFSLLMEGKIPDAVGYAKPVSSHTGELQQVLVERGVELSQNFRSLKQQGQELMANGFSDPVLSMPAMLDFTSRTMSVHMEFQLANTLASSLNNSFQSLLKNQS